MCATEPVVIYRTSYHCQGERLIRKAIGYDMPQAIRNADVPALRDALNHNPGTTQRKLIESRLRCLEREQKQRAKVTDNGSGFGWCGAGKR